jgi:hypothetical protein
MTHEFERLFRYAAGAQPLELEYLEDCSYSAVPRVIGFIYDHVQRWWSMKRRGWYALLSATSRPLSRHAKPHSSADLRKLPEERTWRVSR